jgi:hypothetical protein
MGALAADVPFRRDDSVIVDQAAKELRHVEK